MCQIKTLLYYEEMESVIGPLTIIATENGICRLDFGSMEDNLPSLRSWMAKHFIKGELIHSPVYLEDAIQQLHAYFAGNLHEFSVNYDLFGTVFQKRYGTSFRVFLMVPLVHTRKLLKALVQLRPFVL